jgi:hypothetical protein
MVYTSAADESDSFELKIMAVVCFCQKILAFFIHALVSGKNAFWWLPQLLKYAVFPFENA